MKTCCISEGTHNKATVLSMRLCKTLFLTWRGLVFFFIFFLELISYCEGSWSVDKFPNPMLQPGKCGFTGTYCHSNDCLICDPDGLLTSDEVISLNNRLLDIQMPCSCESDCTDGGYPIAIALADRIQSSSSDFQPAVVKCDLFAESLRDSWFDDDACDDGTLIFFSFHYKELSLSIGEQVEIVFSDLEIAALSKLSQDVLGEGAFKRNQIAASNSTQTFLGFEKVIEQLHAGILNGPSITSTVLYLIVVPAVLIVLITVMCLLANWCCRPELEAGTDKHSGKHNVGHTGR